MRTVKPIKVSIITATYNSEQYVEDTILSVINQTYADIEYIIVDGGSRDNTIQIAQRYRDKIATLISEPDKGVYDAFNKGIRASTGDIIYFLNSDDFLYNESIIEMVASRFNENRELNAVYGNVLHRGNNTETDQIHGWEFSDHDFIKGYMPPHQALFVKRDMFDKHGFFDLTYRSSSDFDFISKLIVHERNNLQYVNKIMAVFRLGGLSTHYKTRMIGMRENEQLIEKHFNQKVNLTDTEMTNNALYRHWLESLLLEDKGITSMLREQHIRNVSIFGTMKTAHYLLADLVKEGFRVETFIDNNPNMQGKQIRGIPIVPSQWLNANQVDAVIVSLENNRDVALMDELRQSYGKRMKVISWKQLI